MRFILLMQLFAATAVAGVMATRNWTSNYVSQAINSFSPSGSSEMLVAFFQSMLDSGVIAPADDFATSNGVTTVYFVRTGTNGAPELVKSEYYVDVEQVVTPPYHGARVVASAVTNIPAGTLYASVDGALECLSLPAGFDRLDLAMSGDGWYIGYDSATYKLTSAPRGDTILASVWDGFATNAAHMGTFTLEPFSLTAEDFAAATTNAAATNAWCSAATNQTTTFTVTFTPVDPPISARQSRMRMAPGQETDGRSVEIELFYVGPAMVNYKELKPPPKGKKWSPEMGYPPGAWENKNNWKPVFPCNAAFVDKDADGNPIESSRTIPNEVVWNVILANYDVRIPPFGYNYPQLVDDFTCSVHGHIWGPGCVCTECGATRAHEFGPVDGYACWRCINVLTEKKDGADGAIRVVETDEICGEKDTADDLTHHGGWHHEGGESAEFNCACECGTFGPSGYALAHNLSDSETDYAIPEDAEEAKRWHYKVRICARCGHEVVEREEHKVSPNSQNGPGNLRYVDPLHHMANGTCELCQHTIEGVLVSHLWGYYGSDENFCKCPCFVGFGDAEQDGTPLTAIHEEAEAILFNKHNPLRWCAFCACWRCGTLLEPGSSQFDEILNGDVPKERERELTFDDHQWSWEGNMGGGNMDNGDGVVDTEYHYCNCGRERDRHIMGDEVCGVRFCVAGERGTGGCGYKEGDGRKGFDRREGEDSNETGYQPERPTSDSDDSDNSNRPPIPTLAVTPDPNPPPPPMPVEPPPSTPMVPIDVPITPLGRGDSTTVDPNVHRNDWQVVSMPYPPPPMPALLPVPPDFSR